MGRIASSFRNLLRIRELRGRLLWTAGLLVAFRVGAHVLVPGVHMEAVRSVAEEISRTLGGIWAFLDMLSGGAIGNLALFSLGIAPYITASILVQLWSKLDPKLEAVAKEGPSGRRALQRYTRYLTVPIALVQAAVATGQLSRLSAWQVRQGGAPLLVSESWLTWLTIVAGLTAGALLTMWIGEQITERGLGNGASVLIMAGIAARAPVVGAELLGKALSQEARWDAVFFILAVGAAALALTVGVAKAQRRIPLQHPKHVRGRRVVLGGRNYLPILLNTAGVMPVIFASSLMVIPQLVGLLPGFSGVGRLFAAQGFWFHLFEIVAILFFAYFWTYLFMRPDEVAQQLKENGSFVPGVRPGENTAAYLDRIVSRLTLVGASFLCGVALVPGLLSRAVGLGSVADAFLGGTSLLILVGVALDLVRKFESYLLLRHYEGILGKR